MGITSIEGGLSQFLLLLIMRHGRYHMNISHEIRPRKCSGRGHSWESAPRQLDDRVALLHCRKLFRVRKLS